MILITYPNLDFPRDAAAVAPNPFLAATLLLIMVYEEHALLLLSRRSENSDWILQWWPHIPKATIQRRLWENNRNATVCWRFSG